MSLEKEREFIKEAISKMKLCPNCKGAITYDVGGKEYCATNGCDGGLIGSKIPPAKFTNKATQLAGVCGSCKQDLQALSVVGSWGCKTPNCRNYGLEFVKFTVEDVVEVEAKKVESVTMPTRVPVNYNFQSLYWSFIKHMAIVGKWGGDKRGESGIGNPTYMNAPYLGDKSPLNHMAHHMTEYILNKPHTLGSTKWHLVAIAFNAMIEFFWFEKGEKESDKCYQCSESLQSVKVGIDERICCMNPACTWGIACIKSYTVSHE